VQRAERGASISYIRWLRTLHAGHGLDWLWTTDTQGNLNVKKLDLQN
jgi:hypothetical protein